MINHFLTFVLFLSPCFLFAGGAIDINGGGHVVVTERGNILLDLWESDVAEPWIGKKPYFKFAQELSSKNKRFKSISTLVSNKLGDVADKDAVLAMAIRKALLMYNWQFIDGELAKSLPVDLVRPVDLQQAAVRKGFYIYLSQPIWKALNKQQQVALIVHEALMALADVYQPESRARQVNSLFFNENFLTVSASDFRKSIKNLLPNVQDLTDLENCSKNFPSSFCSKYKNEVWDSLLLSPENYLLAPYLVNPDSNSFAPQSVKWSTDSGHNIRWTCAFAIFPYVETEYRALELKLSFVSAGSDVQSLPSKLLKGYSSKKISSFIDSDFIHSDECIKRLAVDEKYSKTQSPLMIFEEIRL